MDPYFLSRFIPDSSYSRLCESLRSRLALLLSMRVTSLLTRPTPDYASHFALDSPYSRQRESLRSGLAILPTTQVTSLPTRPTPNGVGHFAPNLCVGPWCGIIPTSYAIPPVKQLDDILMSNVSGSIQSIFIPLSRLGSVIPSGL